MNTAPDPRRLAAGIALALGLSLLVGGIVMNATQNLAWLPIITGAGLLVFAIFAVAGLPSVHAPISPVAAPQPDAETPATHGG